MYTPREQNNNNYGAMYVKKCARTSAATLGQCAQTGLSAAVLGRESAVIGRNITGASVVRGWRRTWGSDNGGAAVYLYVPNGHQILVNT